MLILTPLTDLAQSDEETDGARAHDHRRAKGQTRGS